MVKAEMIYNLDDMKSLARKTPYPGRLRIPIVIITILAAIATGYFLLYYNAYYNDYLYITIITTIVGVFAYTYFYVNLPEKNYNRFRAANGNIPEKFEFDSELVTIVYSASHRSSIDKLKYSAFYKCIETDNHFFFYLSPYSIYIMRKESITEGSIEELRGFIQNAMKDRFTAYRK